MFTRNGLAALLLALATSAAAQTQADRDTRVQSVTDAAQVHAIESRLQVQLDRIGGARITGCGPVLRLIAPQTSGLAETTGASCALEVTGARIAALMCEDSRDRQFALTLTPITDVDAMRRFFVANCYPTG